MRCCAAVCSGARVAQEQARSATIDTRVMNILRGCGAIWELARAHKQRTVLALTGLVISRVFELFSHPEGANTAQPKSEGYPRARAKGRDVLGFFFRATQK